MQTLSSFPRYNKRAFPRTKDSLLALSVLTCLPVGTDPRLNKVSGPIGISLTQRSYLASFALTVLKAVLILKLSTSTRILLKDQIYNVEATLSCFQSLREVLDAFQQHYDSLPLLPSSQRYFLILERSTPDCLQELSGFLYEIGVKLQC